MAGRPKIQLDYALIEKLATIQCTQEEIANIVGVNISTLKRDDQFCTIHKKESNRAKVHFDDYNGNQQKQETHRC